MTYQAYPMLISAHEALRFHYVYSSQHPYLMVMAAHWRVDIQAGDEDWFEELTADELEDDYFLEDFADADFQLWVR